MIVQLGPRGARLVLTLLSLAALTLAGFWYWTWSSGRSELRVPDGAYLVRLAPEHPQPALTHLFE
ncbi:MAG: hypothetical protein ACM3ZA_14615 [Bacillota bacterium]